MHNFLITRNCGIPILFLHCYLYPTVHMQKKECHPDFSNTDLIESCVVSQKYIDPNIIIKEHLKICSINAFLITSLSGSVFFCEEQLIVLSSKNE